MPLYVLDSDILSLLQSGHPQVSERAAKCSPGELAVSVITVEEQIRGWFTLVRRAKKPPQIAFAYQQLADRVSDLSRTRILPYTERAIAIYHLMKKAKLRIDANDLRIAAITMEHSGIVVTRNVRDFREIPGVSYEDWSQ
jgi:tRNA(fMet)-specific endonuclease VapC